MEKTSSDAYRYSLISVFVFGILGNILVIISILRQRKLLKNNYYFLILQLAICDLGWLVVNFFDVMLLLYNFVEKELILRNFVTYCLVIRITFLFQVTGIYMMLVISVLRYRATVHPLKPAVSRRKLKVVCILGYILGLIAGYGTNIVTCFEQQLNIDVYWRFLYAYGIFFFYAAPTVFMAVVYYKIGRALAKQNKSMKTARSNPVEQSTSGSSFRILKYVQNRRTFLVCLTTVLCYGVGNLPISVWFIWYIAGEDHLAMKYFSIRAIGVILRILGTCSVNPLIYGIFDKKLLTFWKLCRKRIRRTQEI
jgi:hypothetical protein